ncbi:MAG TPA: hypothetical protein VF701_16470 [Thermoanaerobaculia bacterium]
MRKLLLFACILLLPSLASAQSADALLTPDGTFFTLEMQKPDEHSDGIGEMHLVLHGRQGEKSWSEVVPATAERGVHINPAMAYESESGMLFVFWIRHLGLMYNELVFASRDREGIWAPATAFGSPYDFRENLRIAVTRKVRTADPENPVGLGVTVHATWWQFNSFDGGETAEYAMLSIDKGRVSSIEVLDLAEFTAPAIVADFDPEAPVDSVTTVNPIVKRPLLFPSANQESVLLLFGDMKTQQLNRVRIFPVKPPVEDGRLRVPVGRTEGAAGSAPKFATAANGQVEGIFGDSDRLLLYTKDAGMIEYSLLKGNKWVVTRSIALDKQITEGAAVDALRRLVVEH